MEGEGSVMHGIVVENVGCEGQNAANSAEGVVTDPLTPTGMVRGPSRDADPLKFGL